MSSVIKSHQHCTNHDLLVWHMQQLELLRSTAESKHGTDKADVSLRAYAAAVHGVETMIQSNPQWQAHYAQWLEQTWTWIRAQKTPVATPPASVRVSTVAEKPPVDDALFELVIDEDPSDSDESEGGVHQAANQSYYEWISGYVGSVFSSWG